MAKSSKTSYSNKTIKTYSDADIKAAEKIVKNETINPNIISCTICGKLIDYSVTNPQLSEEELVVRKHKSCWAKTISNV